MSPYVFALGFVACLGLAAWGVMLIRDVGPAGRLDQSAAMALSERRRSPLVALFDRLARRLEASMVRWHGSERVDRVARRLDSAGRPYGMSAQQFLGRKGALTVLLVAAGLLLLLSSGNPIWSILYAVAGWTALDTWLASKARRRQALIDRDLPDFLDVLAVSVSAGVGFRPALRRVSEGMGGPASEEMLAALQQIELGIARREAFEALRDRNESEFIAQFVAAVQQAEELGVPLRDALIDLAGEMRRDAHQRARRRAQRAGPRVSLITTTLIVPGAMILILAALFAGGNIDIGDTLGR